MEYAHTQIHTYIYDNYSNDFKQNQIISVWLFFSNWGQRTVAEITMTITRMATTDWHSTSVSTIAVTVTAIVDLPEEND